MSDERSPLRPHPGEHGTGADSGGAARCLRAGAGRQGRGRRQGRRGARRRSRSRSGAERGRTRGCEGRPGGGDPPIAEKIRDLFAAKSDRTLDKIFASKRERAAVEAFYQTRNLAPLWLDRGVENARATAAIAQLGAAEAEGLDPK